MKRLRSDEAGIVSIVVTVILITLMSLIVLAMTQNASREQRQTLDRQLSDQAFYNAESGINDIAAYLYKVPDALPDSGEAGTKCLNPLPAQLTGQSDIDGNDGVNKYTCVIYNKAPRDVIIQELSLSTPKIIPIFGVGPDGSTEKEVSKIEIAWDDASGATIDSSCDEGKFTSACTYGGVRTEIFSAGANRSDIMKSTFSVFMMPSPDAAQTGATTVGGKDYPDSQGIISRANCTGGGATRKCKASIEGISRNDFFVSLRSLYRPVNITMKAYESNGAELRLKNAQIMVDSTGRANDILRRVQVRLSAGNQIDLPGYGLQTRDSICKVLEVDKEGTTGTVSSADTTNCPIN